MSFDLPADVVVPVRSVRVRLDPAPHPFVSEHQAAIADHWVEVQAGNPAVYDGEVALLSSLRFEDNDLVGRCHIVRYSAFLYWRKLRPVGGAGHAYTHAMLVSSDNALVLIRMAANTVNAGLVYCAAGSFEPADFREGMADLEYNMRREVLEETGLDIAGLRHEPYYHVLSKTTGTVLFRRYFHDLDADELARRIHEHVAGERDPEIEGPVIVRDRGDLPDRLAPQMPALIDWHFSTPRIR
ncbi:NUDIX hydrolase [Mesorhizobium sp. CAU 1741]|uniref:NUDIX hydrolase n=1 Tax=Mesorhizobium sp. CAU 1741 TaxID=3140366 RepID=UPI00325AD1B5